MSPKTEGFPFKPMTVTTPIVFASAPTTTISAPALPAAGDSPSTTTVAGGASNANGRHSPAAPFLFFFSQPLEGTSQNSLLKRKPRPGQKSQQKPFKGYRNVACGTDDESSDVDSTLKVPPSLIAEFTKSVSPFVPVDAATQTPPTVEAGSTQSACFETPSQPVDYRFDLEKVKNYLSKDVNIVFRKPAVTPKKDASPPIDISSIDKGRLFRFSFKPSVKPLETEKDIPDTSKNSVLCSIKPASDSDDRKESVTLPLATSTLLDSQQNEPTPVIAKEEEEKLILPGPLPNRDEPNDMKQYQLFPSTSFPANSSEPKNVVTGFSFNPFPASNSTDKTDKPPRVFEAVESFKSQTIVAVPYVTKPQRRLARRKEVYTRPIISPNRKSSPLPLFTNTFAVQAKAIASNPTVPIINPTSVNTNVPIFSPTGVDANVSFKPTGVNADVPIFKSTGINTDVPIFKPTGVNADVPIFKSTGVNADVPIFKPTGVNANTLIFKPTGVDANTPIFKPTGVNANTPIFKPTGVNTNTPIFNPTGVNANTPIFKPTGVNANVPIFKPTGIKANTPIFKPNGVNANTPIFNPTGVNANVPIFKPAGVNANVPIFKHTAVNANVPIFKTFVKAKRHLMKTPTSTASSKPFGFVTSNSSVALFPVPTPHWSAATNATNSGVISFASSLLPIPSNKPFSFVPRNADTLPVLRNSSTSALNGHISSNGDRIFSLVLPSTSQQGSLSDKKSASTVVSLATSNVASLCQPMASLSISQDCEANACVGVNTNNVEIQITNNSVKIIINPKRET